MPSLSLINNYLCDFTTCCDANKRDEIATSVWQEFGRVGAVCIIDMCGFTKACREQGTIYYLSMVRRMQLIVEPIINRHQGSVVKFEADNCFAQFDTVADALNATQAIFAAVAIANQDTPDDLDIELSVGIDYGQYLLLNNDYWGPTVNHASKLGEDIAGKNMTLLTDSAWEQVQHDQRYQTIARQYSISGVTIDAYEMV